MDIITKKNAPDKFQKLRSNYHFGGRSLYDNKEHNASISAIAFIQCVAMGKEDFEILVRPILDNMEKV